MATPDRLDLRRTDLNLAYRPQREWIDGRGLLLPIAHFFSGVGAGAWIFSALFEFEAGRILGLLIVAVFSGLTHLAFLGRWDRFWRMARRPHKSWISRGIWGITIFLAGATGLIAAGTDSSAFGGLCLGVSLFGAGVILLYEGFVYVASVAIAFWRSNLLPLLSIAYGLRGGAAALLILAALGEGAFDVEGLEAVKLWVVVSSAVLLPVYLLVAARAGGAAQNSMLQLVSGRISLAFYVGAIGVGIVVPLSLGIASQLADTGNVVLALVGVASLVGDFSVRYSVVKAGVYEPLRSAALPAIDVRSPLPQNVGQRTKGRLGAV